METETALTITKKSWIEMLDEHRVETLAIHALEDHRLVQFFIEQPSWSPDSHDKDIVVFTRTTPPPVHRRSSH